MNHRTAPKTYRVKSFGCQMNVYDGERMGELLSAQGMAPAAEGEEAELVVLNTCHIREKAAEKVYSDIGRLVKVGRKAGKTPMIAVAGCVAQAEGEEIMDRAPAVSVVVGPQAYHRLPELLGKALAGERAADTDMPAIAKFAALPERRKIGAAAFLTVQEGCDKFCTYCVVPYTRGAEISRPYKDLLTEAHKLVEAGAKEITLLGQNVSAWSGEDAKGRAVGLAGLIRDIAKTDGLARIRYTTSHPADMDDDLIAAHGEVEKLMPFLHLPVQAGSDRVLRAMNRIGVATRWKATSSCSTVSAPRGPIWRSAAISSSAFPARPRPSSPRRSAWSMPLAMRRRSASNTARVPAHRRQAWMARSRPW